VWQATTLAPLSDYLSFGKFSPTHKTFLVKNTTFIPSNVFEALFDKRWKLLVVGDEELEALEKIKTWELDS